MKKQNAKEFIKASVNDNISQSLRVTQHNKLTVLSILIFPRLGTEKVYFVTLTQVKEIKFKKITTKYEMQIKKDGISKKEVKTSILNFVRDVNYNYFDSKLPFSF